VPLVKAVQEQQQMIEKLRKQNTEQKNLNDELKKRLEKLERSIK
jgi:hypothetical protein